MKSTVIGVVLLFGCFLAISNAQVPAAQENCTEGEPRLGEIQPDVNLTVLPGTTIEPLTNISVICDAGPPRFPNSSANTSNLPPENIKIYVGADVVQECVNLTQCIYNLITFFPILPRRISCTAANANEDCRFKAVNILFPGETTVAPSTSPPATVTSTTGGVTPPVPTTEEVTTTARTTEQVTPPLPTTVTTTEGDEDTESEEESESESESEDSDSDSDSD